ncbi:FAD binding domain-containing protein [Phaeobacter inhibens]|uniref:FAD binding domain-containing protein n=1 Tax=Phaeobacter inhibens TaxID=221822 RepID=UPI000C9C2F12|nr:xanthine dehydrogenase family protein subunit M [Phaeobacter inhibens]AUQ62642.1 molybdopterin dehydrogenase, FAD-binding protein [Phaeobacter inhibens]AUQ82545.1 molybdopterin dehydrogenase, FAD-binding protein [Phaeobacter inhibens]AUQ90306.1 molybdopterin dehydrogenase, FAD-binding protein [Phaeobacter inhibens]MDO6754924.1 xanthine dehydrogenase family protein subunit M [Phaeobacter inhibens]UWR50670.1 xanthine dehydrogenase family protein subunit M [Phaeobacter inhibens]
MEYHRPSSFAEAAELAASAKGVTRVLAGGTDVLVQMRADIVTPDTLIDIKSIEGARDIRQEDDGSWTIGAAVAGAEMSEHPALCAAWPGVVEAMDLIGSTQVQGRATLVGNLCNASPAADSVPALVAANATVSITGPKGHRRAAAVDIPSAPGKTTLTPGELITAVHLPAAQPGQGDAYLRFIPRTEMDIAVVGCGVWLRLEGDTIAEARVALGAVAPTVLRVQACADALVGATLDTAALERLATAASDACAPITDKRGTIAFRTQVAGVMARRAAEIAYTRAKGDTV